MLSRTVTKKIKPTPTSDGAGVKLGRVIGGHQLSELDPFLLLDEFKSDDPDAYIAGFPSHPHRGFETVTIMLDGYMEHKDNKGNKGLLTPGSVQWMTAGRGIVHSEMPKMDKGLMRGFQLWVNLPAEKKMMEPRYQDILPEDIPVVQDESEKVRVLAGCYKDTEGPVKDIVTSPLLLDVTLAADKQFSVETPTNHAFFAYLFEGSALLDDEVITAPRCFVYSTGDKLEFASSKDESARFLVVGATPLNEPVVRHGPFVMNTKQEIMQAFSDYHSGKF